MLAAIAYLREIREKKDIKQIQVANVIGMSVRQYSRWETGNTRRPDVENLFRVADYLGASLEQVGRLLISDDASDEDAKLLARKYLTVGDRRVINTLPQEVVEDAQRVLDGLSTRDLLDELVRREGTGPDRMQSGPVFAR